MTDFFTGLMPMWLGVALAGIWPMIGYFGAGGGVLLALVAAAIFSPVFKKEFLWAAAVVGCFMVAFTMGVVTGEKRVRAQWKVAKANSLNVGKKARVNGVRDAARTAARKLPAHRDPDLRD